MSKTRKLKPGFAGLPVPQGGQMVPPAAAGLQHGTPAPSQKKTSQLGYWHESIARGLKWPASNTDVGWGSNIWITITDPHAFIKTCLSTIQPLTSGPA
jgi:hypothetical protein